MTDTITCPVCEATNPAGHSFCENCGAPLEAAEHSSGESSAPEEFLAEESFSEDESGFQSAPSSGIIKKPDFSEASEVSEADEVEAGEVEVDDDDEFTFDDEQEVALESEAEEEPSFDDDPSFDDEQEIALESEVEEEPSFDEDFAVDQEQDFPQEFDDSDEFPLEAEQGIASEGEDEESFGEDALEEEAAFDEEVVFEEEAAEVEAEEPKIVAQRTTERSVPTVEPLPVPGTYPVPPSLVIFRDQSVVESVDIDTEITFIGSGAIESTDGESDSFVDDVVEVEAVEVEAAEVEAVEVEAAEVEAVEVEAVEVEAVEVEAVEDEAVAGPNRIDLSSLDDPRLAAKHIAIFRQNRNYTLWVLCDSATQLNDESLRLGDRRSLQDGDVIVLGEETALRFTLAA